jgi:hypothetical protein
MMLFTVERANRTLPLVRKIVEDVVRQHRLWREKILELDLVASAARASEPRDRAEELDIQLKDRRLGLVDFPSEMNGRHILLCWRLGEPEVQFWHELDAGYAGRQPLSPSLVG